MAGEFAKFFIEIGSKFNPKGLKTAQKSIDKTKKKAGDLGGTLKKLGGVLAGGLIARQMMNFAKESFNAFAKQEKAVNNLNSALKNLNIFTVELSENLQKEASAIQKVTTVGDETTLASMQLGLSMGVTSDNIALATKQAIGLSKAYGVDLNASMKMVALAQQGEYTMLNRYIPQLRALKTDTEKAAMTTKLLADGFKLAQAETKIAEGRLVQMTNRLGDLQEEIGGRLIPIFNYLMDLIDDSLTILDFLREKWAEAFPYTVVLRVRTEVIKLIGTLGKFITLIPNMADQWLKMQKKFNAETRKLIDLERKNVVGKDALQKKSNKNTIKNGETEIESAEDIAKKKKAVDDWYLSDKGIAETNFYKWLHGEIGNWDALTLEQKEETMLKVQATFEKTNTSMVGGFGFALNKMRAAGMGWATAWDGMFSGVMSGMSSSIKTFITSSGSMFDNFRTLLDGIFKSILDSFISMVSQMIAKWAILNIMSGGGVGFGMNLLGGFAKGGPVKQTGPYLLHKDEEVIPADIANAVRQSKGNMPSTISNKNSIGGATTVLNQTVNIAGTSETDINVIARKLTKATRDGLPAETDLAKTIYKIGKNKENETVL